MLTRVDAPLPRMLEAAEGTVRFHMPGHKGLLNPHDMTELARTDDLYAPTGGIAEAETLAARSMGAARTLMLTGGSTVGLLAMILSCVSPGETLILRRGVHHAALSACIFGGIEAVFSDDPVLALDEHPGAKAVLVTRPDYYGRCPDLAPVVRRAHERGARVLVDEAHGAHFAWWDTPESAGRLGADAWVQSAHKTLPALTGCAWLHLSASMDACRARRFLRMAQTSSPPFPLLESLDQARAWMDANGARALDALKTRLADFRARLSSLEGYAAVPTDDPTRLVIETVGRGYSGLQTMALLSARRIDVEMADDNAIVCICTVCDAQTALDRLHAALAQLPCRAPLSKTPDAPPPLGTRRVPLREAALGAQEPVPFQQAEGRISSVSAGIYPPGIPWILPGEEISAACLTRLLAFPGFRRFGVEENCIQCLK